MLLLKDHLLCCGVEITEEDLDILSGYLYGLTYLEEIYLVVVSYVLDYLEPIV